jgi:hypothetical protein
MSHVNRNSAFVFVSALMASLTLIPAPAHAVTTSFDQVSWGNGTGGFEDQSSQWGRANVSFSASDIGSLTAFGSGYMGWVNIVASVGGGSNNNWAVQNEPVVFDNLADLNGSTPFSFSFDLGQTDGTAVNNLNYSLTLSTGPLGSEPGGPLSLASVAAATEVEGNQTDPNSEGNIASTAARDSIGIGAAAAAGAALALTGRGAVQTPLTNIPSVNESDNGCAPGAAARSIRYLGNMFPSLNVTQSAQGIYGTLTNLMMSDTGPGSSNGTRIANFISGKNLYFTTNNLSIAPTVVTTNFGQVISALNSTGDVEIGVSWGYNVVGGVTNYLGGHAVMVTGVTTIYSNGVPVRYIVDVVQDPLQGSGSTTNETDRYEFDTMGNLLNKGGMGARINNFRIETVVPEPATIELAALGLGALGFSLARRRRGRKRS